METKENSKPLPETGPTITHALTWENKEAIDEAWGDLDKLCEAEMLKNGTQAQKEIMQIDASKP